MFPGSIYYGCPLSNHPLNRGLVACWHQLPWWFSGPRIIELGNKHTPAIPSGTTRKPARRQGGWGCISMAGGASEWVDVTTMTSAMVPNDFTLGMWIKTTDTTSDRSPIGHWADQGYMFYSLSNTDLRLYGGNGAENFAWSGGWTAVADGTWHHLMATKIGTAGTIYLDGVSRQTGTLAASNGTAQGGGRFNIGTYANRANGLAFDWDDARVYNRGLSAEDVKRLFRQGQHGYPSLLNRVEHKVYFGVTAAAGAASIGRRTLLGVGV